MIAASPSSASKMPISTSMNAAKVTPTTPRPSYSRSAIGPTPSPSPLRGPHGPVAGRAAVPARFHARPSTDASTSDRLPGISGVGIASRSRRRHAPGHDEPGASQVSTPTETETGTEIDTTDNSSRSNAYDIFMMVLTILSLLIMVALLLPLSSATISLLEVYDNLICVVFLGDFAFNLARSRPRSDYFISRRGWLDLLGSIPSLGVFRFSGVLRLARLSRLARITRLLRGKHKRELIHDVVTHRGQYAAFITVLAAFIVLVVSSVLVLQFESRAPDANI